MKLPSSGDSEHEEVCDVAVNYLPPGFQVAKPNPNETRKYRAILAKIKSIIPTEI